MKHIKNIAAIAAFMASVTHAQNTSTGPVVNLGYAQYQGIYNTSIGVTTFFGLHYAQSPTGNLRWQPPQEIEYNNDYDPSTVIDASIQGPICVQDTPYWNITGNLTNPQPGIEDCLLLDVSTDGISKFWVQGTNIMKVLVPQTPANTRLPVIVQIHGGGYATGNSETYPGYAL